MSPARPRAKPQPPHRAPHTPQLLGLPTFMPEEDWAVDYDAGRTLVERCGARVFEAPIHIEGGSIHSDGEG